MRRVGWDQYGHVAWAHEGNEQIGGDFSVISPLIADPRNLWRAPDGKIYERKPFSIEVDRRTIYAGGEDVATIKNLPNPCSLLINGSLYEVKATTFAVKSQNPGLIQVQMCAMLRGQIEIRVMKAEDIWAEIRAERNRRLLACDWTQVADANITVTQKLAWNSYRQKLRDIPDNQPKATIETVAWPTPPA